MNNIQSFKNTTEGVYLRTRMDGDLFNLQRLKTLKNVEEVIIRDLLFADDAAIVAHTAEDRQTRYITGQYITILLKLWTYYKYSKDKGHGTGN